MKLILFLTLLMLCACDSEEETKIKKALKLAGDNRGELEKVLTHYSADPADSLKLRAARFLIGNMPGHYFLQGEQIEEYRKKIYADSTIRFSSKVTAEILVALKADVHAVSDKIEDIKYINAAFLIRHIDASFEMKQKYAWLADVPFDIFLEYLLPYRIGWEPPMLWRDSLQVAPQYQQKRLFDAEHIYNFRIFEHNLSLRETGFKNMFENLISPSILNTDCRFGVYLHLFETRAKGLPLVIDYIPHYSNRNGYHYWIMDPPLYAKRYEIVNAFDRRTAKVYRRTFSHNPVLKRKRGEYIPSLFLDPFNKDVTDLYFYTKDIEVPIRTKVANKDHHAYLCVFNNLTWKPIASGQFSDSKASFTKMGINSVYLPIVFQEQEQQAFSYPFLVKLNGMIECLIPDTTNLQHLKLTRKNPNRKDLLQHNQNIKETIILASNDKTFKHTDTIFQMYKDEEKVYSSAETETPRPYRYYQIKSVSTRYSYLAECIFYDTNNHQINVKVPSYRKKAFDGDPLTYILLQRDSLLTIDFEQPVTIKRAVCLPRSDGNGVYPGNVYELFYCDLNGWNSLGVKEATDFYIEYDWVPTGALYWLRNLTGGVEERVFTWEDGEQQFW